MKRCPQCNTVFEDDMTFCKEDGTALENDSLPLPSDFIPEDHNDGEQETVLRYTPVNFDISQSGNPASTPGQTQIPPASPQTPTVNPYAPNHRNTLPPTVKKGGGCLKYSLILFIGLVLGGGTVLAIMGIGFVYMNTTTEQNNPPTTRKTPENNSNSATNSNSDTAVAKSHSRPNADADVNKLNGRVIRSRASLKSLPNNRSKRIDRLPKNDRIEIIRRKSPTSIWYEIQCEHGSRGWISGYSIKYNK